MIGTIYLIIAFVIYLSGAFLVKNLTDKIVLMAGALWWPFLVPDLTRRAVKFVWSKLCGSSQS